MKYTNLKHLLIPLVILIMFSCSDAPPYGSQITMPQDISVISATAVTFVLKAVVVDENKKPLNDIPVMFSCVSATIVENSDAGCNYTASNPITLRTNSSGYAVLCVRVEPGGDARCTGDIGTDSDLTAIAVKTP